MDAREHTEVRSEIRTKIGQCIGEGVRSVVGTPRTKTGKNIAEWLFVGLLTVACSAGLVIFGMIIGYP